MKKKLLTMLFVVTFFAFSVTSAGAAEKNMIKVGLRYGSSAMFSANLENEIGSGYEFGWYDEDLDFQSIAETEEIAISMTAAGTIYMDRDGIYSLEEPAGKSEVLGPWHIQVAGFEDFEEAQEFAWDYDGYPAYIDGEYVVRIGFFETKSEAKDEMEYLDWLMEDDDEEEEIVEEELPAEEDVPDEEEPPAEEDAPAEEDPSAEEETPVEEDAPAEEDTSGEEDASVEEDPLAVETYSRSAMKGLDVTVEKSSSTGILVTVTRSTEVLFEFDCSGIYDFGVQPVREKKKQETETWFRGYKYPGGFSYPRVTGGDLHVVNVVDLDEYVKGVIPYEMSPSWPIEALKAQAVCARTFAAGETKHQSAYGFDVCTSNCCQVYYGRGNNTRGPGENSDEAVEETAGEFLWYDGELACDTVYHSSNGGATSSSYHVWGGELGYLQGVEDPYEAEISIPNYEWSVTYTADELTYILKNKGYKVGTVKNVYISEYTDEGNVYKVTFEGKGGTVTVKGDTCRTVFSSATYNKSVRSLRYEINGKAKEVKYYVNDEGDTLSTLEDVYVLTADGVEQLEGGTLYVIAEDGKETIDGSGEQKTSSDGKFTIAGTGWGHNVGMSQYGAKAMAELDYDYEDILTFYYTDVKVK